MWAAARRLWASIPDDEAAVARLLEHDESCLLVAERMGRVVGSLVTAWDGWRGNLYRLAVAPDHRGQGVAHDLVRAGERYLRARGARRVSALVTREDAAAVGLWAACGYRDDPHIGRFARNL